MSTDDKKKKKGGFFKRAFGFKSKEEKLAEAAALKAEQQAQVDAQMAERMALINAAALKAAREQDEAHLSEAEKTRLEAEERKQAEAQAVKDAETAKKLVEEKRKRKEEAKRKAEEEAERLQAEAIESERRATEKLAREKAEAEQIAKLKQAEEQAKQEAERQAKLAKEKLAKAETEEAERLHAEAKAAQKVREQEAASLKAAREQAEAEIAARAEAERLEAGEIEAQRLETERLRGEAEAEQAAKRKELEARLIQEQAERVEKARLEREVWDAEQAAKRAEQNKQGEQGFLGRISQGLSKSTSAMSDNISAIFTKRKLDAEALEDLEDLLIAADFGVGPATRTAELLAKDRFDKQVTDTEIKIALADVISEVLTPLEKPLALTGAKPEIMLFVGVNGSGKTTTLGKIAKRYTDEGKKVLLAAGDTFRAAAVEQLKVWGERSGAPVVSADLGADASGLVYDAITRAKAENYDILMIDTAGRLQNRTELMDELAKIVRVIKKQDDTAPHHSILVLDATVGQNALLQTEAFQKTAGITGLIMTKLDGTAKGGVLVALADKFKLPIHAIGIGERIQDLENFSAPVFAAALSGIADAVVDD
ncbi:signal recognition particle-docking protein FtsY [bacterium AH-315-J19]|nr:signal recognition particle-docking protein FtsY [bacterium AH-315-J19]